MLSLLKSLKLNKIGRIALSSLLAVAVLCSTLSMITLIPVSAVSIWDGGKTEPTKGSGTQADPYEISNGAELAYVITSGGGANTYYEITEDIYLNDIDKVNWATGEAAAGYTPNTWYGDWQVTAFQGTIFGNGHTINGLYYEKQPEKQYTNYYGGVGLFSKAANLTVKDLAVDNSYIHQEASVSAFVAATAANGSINIDGCYAGANVYLKAAAAGAFSGYAYKAVDSTISNSYSLANVTGVNFNGLAAFNWYNSATLVIKNCYNAKGAISSHADTAGYGTLENNYETVASAFNEGNTLLTAANMQGADVFTSAAKMPNLNGDGKFEATDTYPILKAFKAPAGNTPGGNAPAYDVWDGQVATSVQGEGSEVSPFLVTNGAELAYAITNGTAGQYYKLTNNIYLNDLSKINWETGEVADGYTVNEWIKGVSFAANLDGDGYTVYGVYNNAGLTTSQMSEGWDYPVGLIPAVTEGATVTIKNIGVDNMYLNAEKIASPFVGLASSWSGSTAKSTIYIDNCYVGENVDVTAFAAGVFRGYSRNNAISIKNSYNLGKIRSQADKSIEVDNGTYNYKYSWLIGNGWGLDLIAVENVYNATGALYKGSWAALNSKFVNCYAAGLVTEDQVWYNTSGNTPLTTAQMQGLDVFTDAGKMPMLNSTDVYVATEDYPILKVFEGKMGIPENSGEQPADINVWDGTTKTAPADSDNDGVYEITNAAELAYVIDNNGTINNTPACSFILTDDIYINDPSKVNWETGVALDAEYTINSWFRYWKTGNIYHEFAGTIDGDGHTVYGLYFNMPNDAAQQYDAAALIPGVLGNVTIKNLAVDKAYVNYKNGASAFVGYALTDSTVNISNSYAGADVTLIGNDAGVFRAVARDNIDSVLENCYSLATATGVNTYGLIGFNWEKNGKFTFKNCYNANGPLNFGGSPGWYCTAENSYSTEDNVNANGGNWLNIGSNLITADDMKGLEVLSATGKMSTLNSADAYEATAEYPILKVFKESTTPGGGEQPGPGTGGEQPGPGTGGETPVVPDYVWDGTEVAPTEGEGTSASPYIIKTAEELAYIIANGGGANAYYKLANDIYLNSVEHIDWATGEAVTGYEPKAWYDNNAFQGTIDGDGHVVYGLYYKSDATPSWSIWGNGLIPKVAANTTASIANLGVDKAYVAGKHGASAFVGVAGDNISTTASTRAKVYINNCYAGAEVTLAGYDVGAFRGATRGSDTFITNCYTLATLNGTMTGIVGGEAWDASVTIKNTYNAKGKPTSEIWNPAYSFENVYVTDAGNYPNEVTVVTDTNMKGASALTNMSNLNAADAFVATDSYPVLKVFTDDQSGGGEQPGPGTGGEETVTVPDYVWDTTEVAPAQGNGTKANPYLIGTAEELAYIINDGGAANTYYKLTADIYLNAIEHIDWATGTPVSGYNPRVWYDNKPFQGTIDGDGHVVYGLYFNHAGNPAFGYWGNGLVPRVNPGASVTIKKLGVDYAYVAGLNGVSAFVGSAGARSNSETDTNYANVNIDRCYAGANVTLKGHEVGAFRGTTHNSNTAIVNSYSLATLAASGDRCTAGLIGNIWDVTVAIENSYNANGAILTDIWNSGVDAGLKNVYATNKGAYVDKVIELTTDNMKGLDVLTNDAKMPKVNFDEAYVATESYPILKVFTDDAGGAVVETPGQIWTGAAAEEFLVGTGTQDDPYIISTGAELAYAVKNNGFGGKYFELSHDIYLNDVSVRGWYNSSSNNAWYAESAGFNGHIDGKGHIVYGVWYPETCKNESSGLIPVFMAGSIKNLGVRNAQVYAKNFAAGIVGKTVRTGNKVIESCFVDETVLVFTNNNDSATGGIVGAAYDMTNGTEVTLLVKNSYSKASLSGIVESRKNGIIGAAWRTPYSIVGCYSTGYPVYTAADGGEATSAFWNYEPAYEMNPDGSYKRDDGGYLIPDMEKYIDRAREGKKLSDYIYNNYSDVSYNKAADKNNVTIVNSESMRNDDALTSMPNLDYSLFETVYDGTPKLKIFTSINGQDIFMSKDADFFGSGKGTQKDPFVIKTVEHLRYVVESLDTKGKYYKLGNDIYVNDTTNSNWMNNNPAEWYTLAGGIGFAGNFDGAGYKIYGLYKNDTPKQYLGDKYTGPGKEAEWVNVGTALFPYIDPAAQIRNVHIRDSYLVGEGTVGAIAGNCMNGDANTRLQFIACSVDESVTLKGFTVGGILGASHSRGVDLTYCYSTAKMSNTGPSNRLSGLIGDIWSAKVSALETYTTDYQVTFGSLVNTTALYAPVEQFGVTVLNKADMIGSKAKANMKLTWDKVWYIENGKTPQLKVVDYGEEESLYFEGKQGQVWSGKISTGFAGGDGTKENPYLIYTPEQMARIFAVQSSEFTHYKLMADLKLNNTSKANWQDTAKMWYAGQYVFRGVFDGNGHVVSGLYYYNDNNNDNAWAGLFQAIGHSSTIKRLGVTESSIINTGANTHTYAAAICAYLEHWRDRGYKDATAPVISECFGSDSVYLEASAPAGILAATQTAVTIENCYFTGELTGSVYAAGMVADNWAASGYGPTIKNCYAATLDGDPLGDGYGTGSFNDDTVTDERAFLSNCYVAGSSLTTSITPISVMYMKGHDAKKYMPNLDYNKVWKTVEGGTPVLRCFANAEKYASQRNPKEVTISFGNLGDAVVEPLRGYPGYTPISKDELPIPERRGFIFNGWHHHNPDGAEFELTLFPNYDITLYANWTEVGFTQNFDRELDEKYDYNEGIEIYKPGIAGYNTKFVHSGWRSLHTLKDSKVDPEFLVSYEDRLLVGYEYEISFWMTTDEEGTSGKIYFEHANYGDVNDEIVGYEEALTFTGLKAGEWKQYKVKIVANAPYLVVRVEKGTSLFFEDFEAIPTGAKGELGNLLGYNPNAVGGEPGAGLAPWVVAIVIGGGVVVLGGGAAAGIFFLRRKKA